MCILLAYKWKMNAIDDLENQQPIFLYYYTILCILYRCHVQIMFLATKVFQEKWSEYELQVR